MKKLISMLLCLSMIVSVGAFIGPENTAEAAVAYVPGDVNSDGGINARDALALRKKLADMDVLCDTDAADLNEDAELTTSDLLALRKHLAGIEEITGSAPDSTVGRLRIAGNNVKHYSIIVTNPENENMLYAADELRRYVKIATTYDLTVKDVNTGRYRIVLMEDESGTLGDEGYAITVNDGILTIMGGAKRGIMYGVAEVLERYLGYRYYGNSDVQLYEIVNADIPEGTAVREVPDTSYRNLSISQFSNDHVDASTVKRKLNGVSGCYALNNAKYGYGIQRFIANAHSFDVFIPSNYETPCLTDLPDEEDMQMYFTDEFWGDLELYRDEPLNAFEECIANMALKLQERISWGQSIGKEITEISCSYHWTLQFCTCVTCRKLYKAEGSRAAALVDFVNAVSEVILSKYPDLQFITNAYGEVRIPPKTKYLNDNIILLYCWNGCANHPIGTGGCGDNTNSLGSSNTIEEANYLGWTEHCAQTYIWYYPTNIYYMLSPLPNVFDIYQEFKWLIEHKCIGFYVQATSGDAFEGLISYLMSEMMWDKDITYDQYCDLIKEYMHFYYGEGWENIYRYAQMMDESSALQGCFMNDYDHPLTMYNAEYQIAHFEEQEALFNAALAATSDEWQIENIKRLSAHMYFLYYASAYESVYVNGSEAERKEYAEGYEAWYNLVTEYDIRITYQTTGFGNKPFSLETSPMRFVYGTD